MKSRHILFGAAAMAIVIAAALAVIGVRSQDVSASAAPTAPTSVPAPIAKYNLGVAAGQRGDHAAAVEQYQAAIAMDPNFVNAHFNLGVSLTELGRTEEALAAYREVISLDREYAAAWWNAGLLMQKSGQLDEAAAAMRTAIWLDPALAERFPMPDATPTWR